MRGRMSKYRHVVQANAEPDLMQTGTRLKPVVAGVIEGIMQLVVDPLALSQVKLGTDTLQHLLMPCNTL